MPNQPDQKRDQAQRTPGNAGNEGKSQRIPGKQNDESNRPGMGKKDTQKR